MISEVKRVTEKCDLGNINAPSTNYVKILQRLGKDYLKLFFILRTFQISF